MHATIVRRYVHSRAFLVSESKECLQSSQNHSYEGLNHHSGFDVVGKMQWNSDSRDPDKRGFQKIRIFLHN